jgi:hypothetical protein
MLSIRQLSSPFERAGITQTLVGPIPPPRSPTPASAPLAGPGGASLASLVVVAALVNADIIFFIPLAGFGVIMFST